jgi:hypothetical protein
VAGQTATCVVRQAACSGSVYNSSVKAYTHTCSVCECRDHTLCGYNEALGVATCEPKVDCWDPLLGFVSAQSGSQSRDPRQGFVGSQMVCQPASCNLTDAANFACFTGFCDSTRMLNDTCLPRYCECEGPCVVTQGLVTGVCPVLGDAPCIQPPEALDLRQIFSSLLICDFFSSVFSRCYFVY